MGEAHKSEREDSTEMLTCNTLSHAFPCVCGGLPGALFHLGPLHI
jgi:hypothetical protein